MYNYLWPVFGPNSIGNANKNSFITLYSNSVRRYGGVLVSESLCLLVKITQSDEVFFCAFNEFGGYSGIGKKLRWPITFYYC